MEPGRGVMMQWVLSLTQGHPSCRGIIIDPERHPGENGDQDGGHVRLEDEISNVSLNSETQRKPWIWTCKETGCDHRLANLDVNVKSTQKGETCVTILVQLKELRRLHNDNVQGSLFSICSDGALNFPKAMDSFPGTSSIPIKHGRKLQTQQIFLQPPISAGSSSVPLRIVTKCCSAFVLHFLCPLNTTKRVC